MTADQAARDEARQLVVRLVQLLHGDLNQLLYATDERVGSIENFTGTRAWMRARWGKLQEAADAYETAARETAQPETSRP